MLRWPRLGILLVGALGSPACGSPSEATHGSSQAFTEATTLFADKIDAAKARFPILLEHGWASSDDAAPLWRFADVAADLMNQGHALVAAAEVTPFDDVAGRAASMERDVRALAERCKRTAGCDPRGVHIVAHAYGGFVAREYLRQHPPSAAQAEGLPHVVSLATIGTPHRGTSVADYALQLIDAFARQPVIDAPFEAELDRLTAVAGHAFTKEALVSDARVARALHDLSEANAETFGAAHPAVAGVSYFAWAGVSVNPDPSARHPERVTARMPASCGPSVAFADRAYPTDPLLVAAHDIAGHHLDAVPNDGMTTVESAKGLPGATFMGCVPADHLAEVGHYASPASTAWSGFDHRFFYRFVASTLADTEKR